MNVKKLLRIGVVCVLMLLMSFGLLLMIEIGIRIFHPEPDRGLQIDMELFRYHPYVIHTHAPNLQLGNTKNVLEGYFGHSEQTDASGGITFISNSQGFRSREFNYQPKGSNTVRILVVGGSASISWNIGERGRLERWMEDYLKPKFPDKEFEFYNIGNGAWISFQELVALQLYGLKMSPDFVIAYDGFNDIEHCASMQINQAYADGYMRAGNDMYRDWVYGGMSELLKVFKTDDVIRSALKRRQTQSEIATVPGSPVLPELAQKPEPGYFQTKPMGFPLLMEKIMARTDFDPYNRAVVDNYLTNIQCMASILEPGKTIFIAALQPALIFKDPISDVEKRMMQTGYGAQANFVAQGYERMWIGLREMQKVLPNMRAVDLRYIYAGNTNTVFGDNVHVFMPGYKIAGEILGSEIAACISARADKK